MTAWEDLVANSTIPSGTAWQHLQAQGGGGTDIVYLETMTADISEFVLATAIIAEVITANITEEILSANISDETLSANIEVENLSTTISDLTLTAAISDMVLTASIIEETI